MVYALETEMRDYLRTMEVATPKNKDEVRSVMQARKRDNLLAARQQLKRLESRALSLMRRVDYTHIRPRLVHAAPKDRPLWEWCRAIVSSTPFSGRVGRMNYLFCVDDHTGGIMGIVETCSDMLMLPPRDRRIGWGKQRAGKLRHIANVGTCVCVQPFGSLCGGKFQIVAAASTVVSDAWEQKYGDRLAALCTTSLYGESAIYNRLREWEYLGNTAGYGMFHLSEAGFVLLKRFLQQNNLASRLNATSFVPPSRVDCLNRTCAVLGIDRESISSHQPRGVYWCELVAGACEYLRGERDSIPKNTRRQEDVGDWWLERWYSMRLPKKRDEVLRYDWGQYKVDSQIDLCVRGAASGTSCSPA